MPVIKCPRCGKEVLKPSADPPELCAECKAELEEEINRIDRKNDRYTKRGKLKHRLDEIPDEAIPESLALQIEEVANPEIETRQYKLGKMNELKQIGDKEIHQISNSISESDRGKILLKKKYR